MASLSVEYSGSESLMRMDRNEIIQAKIEVYKPLIIRNVNALELLSLMGTLLTRGTYMYREQFYYTYSYVYIIDVFIGICVLLIVHVNEYCFKFTFKWQRSSSNSFCVLFCYNIFRMNINSYLAYIFQFSNINFTLICIFFFY